MKSEVNMYIKSVGIFVILLDISLVQSNDIRIGYIGSNSRKIHSELFEAQPALWRRTQKLTIRAPPNEIISAIYINDLRENKDGEAVIDFGGVGEESVSIELKSPSILRGYKFQVEVYAENMNHRFQSKGYPTPTYDDTQFARKF